MIAPMMIQEMIAQRRPMRGTPFCQGKGSVVQSPVWPRIPQNPRIDDRTAGHGVDHAVRRGDRIPLGELLRPGPAVGMRNGPGVIARPVPLSGALAPAGPQKSQSSSSVSTALPITSLEPEPEKKSWF